MKNLEWAGVHGIYEWSYRNSKEYQINAESSESKIGRKKNPS